MKELLKKLFIFIYLYFSTESLFGQDLLIQDVNLIDGIHANYQENMSILVRDGLIVKIGKDISEKNIPQLDAKGSYLLPGLIDSHVHLMWGPGAALFPNAPSTLNEWKATWGQHYPDYLRAYLACGVTTVLDTATPKFVVQEVHNYLQSGSPGPRFLTLGITLSTPEGYPGKSLSLIHNHHPLKTTQDVEQQFDDLLPLNPIGIKLHIEKGWSPFSNWSRLPMELLEVIRQKAKTYQLPIYVHATSEEDFKTAVRLGVHALVHTFIGRNESLSDSFVEEMANSQTYQMTTLNTMDERLASFEIERLQDPLLRLVVPEEELALANDPKRFEIIKERDFEQIAPWIPEIFRGFILDWYASKKNVQSWLHHAQQAIFQLHDAGVPIVVGSDTVFSTGATHVFHGFSTLRELELVAEAGLSPIEVIKAATSTPAKMLGIEEQVGTVEVGKQADLIILKENPLKNIRAFRSIQWTIKGGTAYTPQEWMTSP